jgi:hypothetical protein
MRLIDRIGDALLTRLVPGIDAKAACGRCKESGHRCTCCAPGHKKLAYFYDACGNFCYTQCQRGGLECLDRPSGC